MEKNKNENVVRAGAARNAAPRGSSKKIESRIKLHLNNKTAKEHIKSRQEPNSPRKKKTRKNSTQNEFQDQRKRYRKLEDQPAKLSTEKPSKVRKVVNNRNIRKPTY